MVTVILKHSVIKKARSKVFVTVAFSELFSYPSRYNPSQKRDARCTNILHTGATLSGVGEGQRLRKGFQGQWRGSLTTLTYRSMVLCKYQSLSGEQSQAEQSSINVAVPTTCLESLSSAAEIRHSARNTRL